MVNAGCREKDLKHINEQLEKYNVSCCARAARTGPRLMTSTSGVAVKRAAPTMSSHVPHAGFGSRYLAERGLMRDAQDKVGANAKVEIVVHDDRSLLALQVSVISRSQGQGSIGLHGAKRGHGLSAAH